MTHNGGALGILQLQNVPQTMAGSLSNPATFSFPTIFRQVPGAWTKNVVLGGEDKKLEAAFISAAKELVSDGAVAITSNCGFTVKYQKAMTQALSVPVSMSSLLLLPYLMATVKGRVGILTFDSRPLTSDLLKCAGIESRDRIAVAGIEYSETWEIMSGPENNYTTPQVSKDLQAAIAFMRKRYDDVEAILFECAGFPIATQEVRKQTQLPVYDAVTNANLLMSRYNISIPESARKEA
ncbi:hypothetical protein J2R76_003837 [Bradyrhizobium sp. USDA 4532]|uniref:aspartate/glutamate racemase family protein n=1 Tax=unclassified Bradyrhizobium TaxID=2631580 RepID=UPI00209E5E5E|nr:MULTISPECIES: aspartate/glutamate racemase family protein [unclassified Bradyrhizobium]MCP1835500.1 hypothetical protein [Bradyrhizobium sp. USDA 4545]MCP1920246.1 hypothetical protein [Bradyrhizobium sp. USDA 4532]